MSFDTTDKIDVISSYLNFIDSFSCYRSLAYITTSHNEKAFKICIICYKGNQFWIVITLMYSLLVSHDTRDIAFLYLVKDTCIMLADNIHPGASAILFFTGLYH